MTHYYLSWSVTHLVCYYSSIKKLSLRWIVGGSPESQDSLIVDNLLIIKRYDHHNWLVHPTSLDLVVGLPGTFDIWSGSEQHHLYRQWPFNHSCGGILFVDILGYFANRWLSHHHGGNCCWVVCYNPPSDARLVCSNPPSDARVACSNTPASHLCFTGSDIYSASWFTCVLHCIVSEWFWPVWLHVLFCSHLRLFSVLDVCTCKQIMNHTGKIVFQQSRHSVALILFKGPLVAYRSFQTTSDIFSSR